MKKNLTFLIFGDVFGSLGRVIVKEEIGSLKKKYKPDLVIANAENLTHGTGLSPSSIAELKSAGVDFFTGGNHSFDNAKGAEVFADSGSSVIRPANWENVGQGFQVLSVGDHKILIINLIGTFFMDKDVYTNPFEAAEKILQQVKIKDLSAILVDFHAEITSEKIAMGYFLDGQISAMWGTHTHVQTADERILPGGTGFITDVGFNGPNQSVIGMEFKSIVHHFRFPDEKVKIKIEETGEKCLNALVVTVDPQTRRCLKIERVNEVIS